MTNVQDAFFDFNASVSQLEWKQSSRLAWHCTLQVAGKRIGIRCLNVAWMSELREKQGSLVYPIDEIVPFNFQPGVGIGVTVFHHPFNWFHQTAYRQFQAAARQESHIIFTGHEHFQNVGEVTDVRSDPSVFVDGGVLFDSSNKSLSTFNVVLVDLDEEKYVIHLYAFNGERYEAQVDGEEWGSLRPLPIKAGQKYPLTEDFSTTLADPGASFSHTAKKKLLIDDFFVWPELLCFDDPTLVKRQVLGSFLEDMTNLNGGVFLRGDEKSGKTTLLRRYFSSYYRRGFLPLYFRGTWFAKAHIAEPLKAMKYALERQYLRKDHAAWLQESKEKRVLFIDDLDQTTLSAQQLSDLLTAIFKYFSGILVVYQDGAEAIDLLSVNRVDALKGFSKYEIREFGHKKRFELVCKWAAIGGVDEPSDRWMATIDKWEKDLTVAVGRQFVPSVPIFLLTLLQSIESGRTADLQNSAFGHYYQFLVTSALEQIGVKREQWNEVFNYCANLAWSVFSSSSKHFSDKFLEQFSEAYSREFTPVGYGGRLRELMEAGVLGRVDGEYEFKYPYLYYLFLGQYLADNLHEEMIKQVIVGLCQDLHLRDNANILLFTSHHARSPLIYDQIVSSLDKCFAGEPVFDFERDAVLLNDLVRMAPTLIYEDGSTKASRANVREFQDSSQLAAFDPDQAISTGAAAMTRLFRGMEILGQLLKNHYGTTKNPVKEELIDRLFQSALRGLHSITELLIRESATFADVIEEAFSETQKELLPVQRQELARSLVFNFVGTIAFGFVQKAATSVGSPYLKTNMQAVVDRKESYAYRLIAMGFQFDLPDHLPLLTIKQLNKDLDKNIFAKGLLRTMALRHLHLFKVPYQDKQKLCAELEIKVSGQSNKPELRINRKNDPLK